MKRKEQMVILPKLAQALLEPDAYEDNPQSIELIQTQMSFVFLTDRYVYKVKKPVDLGYVDYTSLGKRRYFCQREVELNERLCPNIYLGVIPITKDKRKIHVNGTGRIIDYAVKMRRLPETRMMDTLLTTDSVSPGMIDKLARRIAHFHNNAETDPLISNHGSPENITMLIEDDFEESEQFIGLTITKEMYDQIRGWLHSFIDRNANLLKERVENGKVKDCHGDLRVEHVCFEEGIYIFDCIEFNDRFRHCDVASDIAFLAMDLDHYGRADLSHHLIKQYIYESGDMELPQLLRFYKCYRAFIRGKVESIKLNDVFIQSEKKEQILRTASSYFNLANAYTQTKPILIIVSGLIGTGKSTLAQELSKRLGLVNISSDITRKDTADIPLTTHCLGEYNTGIYSAEFSRIVYDVMLNRAEHMLRDGYSVIIDASFSKANDCQKARELSEKLKVDFMIIECVADEETIKHRLIQRLTKTSVSDGRWEIYEKQKNEFEHLVIPLKATDNGSVLVDNTRPIDDVVRDVKERVHRLSRQSQDVIA